MLPWGGGRMEKRCLITWSGCLCWNSLGNLWTHLKHPYIEWNPWPIKVSVVYHLLSNPFKLRILEIEPTCQADTLPMSLRPSPGHIAIYSAVLKGKALLNILKQDSDVCDFCFNLGEILMPIMFQQKINITMNMFFLKTVSLPRGTRYCTHVIVWAFVYCS